MLVFILNYPTYSFRIFGQFVTNVQSYHHDHKKWHIKIFKTESFCVERRRRNIFTPEISLYLAVKLSDELNETVLVNSRNKQSYLLNMESSTPEEGELFTELDQFNKKFIYTAIRATPVKLNFLDP